MTRERYRIGDLTLDVDAVSLRRVLPSGEVDVALPKLSFDLLVALARRAPSVVRTEELIALVWQGVAISDETLTQRAALLRRALGDDAKEPRYLRAVRGRGYQLIPPAEPLTATERPIVSAEAGVATSLAHEERDVGTRGALDSQSQGPELGVVRRSLPFGVRAAGLGLLGLTALAALLSWKAGLLGFRPPAGAAPSPLATRAATVPELLDRAGAYLRQQQEGNNALAIELYRRALNAAPRDPQALAGLSLALSQRATKFTQDDSARSEALDLARRAVGIDPRLGRAHHALGLALDARGSIAAALAAYRRAADLEPEPGPALASAAHLLQIEGRLADALEADLRVAQLHRGNEDSPYLEVQIGATLALLGFDTPAAVWFERALELRPDNVFAATAYAHLHLARGRLREADSLAATALARGVHRPELWETRGIVAQIEGRTTEARRFYEQALAGAPGFLRARTRLLLLQSEEGRAAGGTGGRRESHPPRDLEPQRHALLEEIREGRRQGDEWPDSWIDEALLAAVNGTEEKRPKALEGGAVENAVRGSNAAHRIPPHPRGPEGALAALDGAIERGYRDVPWLLLEPGFATLRDDPAFQRRVADLRARVDAERQRVLGAPWLPPTFLDGGAGRAANR